MHFQDIECKRSGKMIRIGNAVGYKFVEFASSNTKLGENRMHYHCGAHTLHVTGYKLGVHLIASKRSALRTYTYTNATETVRYISEW